MKNKITKANRYTHSVYDKCANEAVCKHSTVAQSPPPPLQKQMQDERKLNDYFAKQLIVLYIFHYYAGIRGLSYRNDEKYMRCGKPITIT